MLIAVNLSAQVENNDNDQTTGTQEQSGTNPLESFADTVQKRINQVDEELTKILDNENLSGQYQSTINELDEKQRELRSVVTQYNQAIEQGAESEAKQLEKNIDALINEIETDLNQLRSEIEGDNEQ